MTLGRDPDFERRVAFHEAAHAVIGAALRLPQERVTVVATDEVAGSAVHDRSTYLEALCGDLQLERLWVHAELYALAAPAVAEAILENRSVDWQDPCLGGDVNNICALAERVLPFEEDGSIEVLPFFRRGERGARLLLQRHWQRIERFADLLHAEQTLEGERLTTALEGLASCGGARARIADWYAAPDWLE